MRELTSCIAVVWVQTNKGATHSLVRGCIIWEASSAFPDGPCIQIRLHEHDVNRIHPKLNKSPKYFQNTCLYRVYNIYARINIMHSSRLGAD